MNLAYKLRPTTLSQFIGQKHLTDKGKILRVVIENKTPISMILWGPPGSGKTTLAYIIASETNAQIHILSGVESGKSDLLKIRDVIKKDKSKSNHILFIDEIHRWNKSQQDALLHDVESGLITLIGATTENPSFEVNSALLSRSRVFILQNLSFEDLSTIINHALTDDQIGLGAYKKNLSGDAREVLIRLSGGDARIMLNALELAATNFKQKEITAEIIQEIFQNRSASLYDKKADEHYNTISAFIKSMRGSDPNATLYYLMRMLENGEDPTFIARRMIIFASEDIGLADRGALIQANAGFEAVQKIGMPEAQLVLSHIALYLATAKKSRAVANALSKAKEAVFEFPNEPIPLHLRNAPTKLMKNIGYAKNYEWSQNYVGPKENQSFLPEKLKGKKFFPPLDKSL